MGNREKQTHTCVPEPRTYRAASFDLGLVVSQSAWVSFDLHAHSHAPPECTQVTLGKRIDVPVFEMGTDAKPADIAANGVNQAKKVQIAWVSASSVAADALVTQNRVSVWNIDACQHRITAASARACPKHPANSLVHMHASRAPSKKVQIC